MEHHSRLLLCGAAAMILGGSLAGAAGATTLSGVRAAATMQAPGNYRGPLGGAYTAPLAQRMLQSSTASWPQSYYDPGHTGYNPKEKTLSPSNVSALTLLGGPNTGCVPEAVVLNQGTLYTRHSGCGSIGGTLAAFDAVTFVQKWSATVGNWQGGNIETIAVGENRVMTGCASTAGPGLCAYSASSGKLLWSYNPACSGCGQSLDTSLAYSNGVIYVFFNVNVFGPNYQYIQAIDVKTGNQLWSNQIMYGYSGGLVVGGGYVYYVCSKSNYGNGMCALSQANGGLVWSNFPQNGLGYGATAYSKGTVYVNSGCSEGCTPQVAAFNGQTGSLIWSNTSYGGSWQNPAVAKGVVYVPVSTGPSLIALSGATGAVRWADPETDQSGPSVANGVVYTVTTLDSQHFATVAHRASNGQVLWSAANYRQGNLPPPIIANGTLYSPDNGPTCGVCAYGLTGMAPRSVPFARHR